MSSLLEHINSRLGGYPLNLISIRPSPSPEKTSDTDIKTLSEDYEHSLGIEELYRNPTPVSESESGILNALVGAQNRYNTTKSNYVEVKELETEFLESTESVYTDYSSSSSDSGDNKSEKSSEELQGIDSTLMENEPKDKVEKQLLIVEGPAETLTKKDKKTYVTRPSTAKLSSANSRASHNHWSQVAVSSSAKLVTLDEDEAEYDEEYENVPEVKISKWRKVCGNYLCPKCGITRWRKNVKMSYTDPKAKDVCSQILCVFNSLYYYFANQLGPDVKYYAEELFFQRGQIEADGLCAISAQIWAATYLLRFEVQIMGKEDWEEIRELYLDLVWESEKSAEENRKFYKLHQEFKANINEHMKKLEKLVGYTSETFIGLDPPVDPKQIRPMDGLYINDKLLLKHRLVLLVTNPHEETHKFEDFSDSYRLKTIKHFLGTVSLSAIVLGQSIINKNSALLKNAHLPLLTPNCPPDESKFTYTDGMENLENDLKSLFEEVYVPAVVQSDLIDWVSTIKDLVEQYSSYGEWIADKLNEIKDMCQLCYEFADKVYSLELPSIELIRHSIEKNATDDVRSVRSTGSNVDMKPKLSPCKIPVSQRLSTGEKYESKNDKLENYNWKDFFRTEYHGVATRLPIMRGPTEFIFHEAKHKKAF